VVAGGEEPEGVGVAEQRRQPHQTHGLGLAMALCSRSKPWGVGRGSVEELRRLTAASETAGDNRSDDRRRPHRGVLLGVVRERCGSIERVPVLVASCVRDLCVSALWAGLKPVSVYLVHLLIYACAIDPIRSSQTSLLMCTRMYSTNMCLVN
jgi:hypothetical protein